MRPFEKLAREEELGRYRLIARLGQGGMADVFLARLVGAGGFEKLVAVKRMLPNLTSDPRFVAMFLNEGRIAARLDHPNVCQVYELAEADGTLFLAMEFLRGLPWSEVVPAIPDQPRATLVRFVVGAIAQACEGLHHAHTAVGADGQSHPIVHRDVSPSNLFVTNEGVVKLLDFGVSKVLTESRMTATGVLKGKLPYMSPDQLRNMSLDARTDIFSLAVVTWEALAGRALFDRESDYETMTAVAEAEIPALPGDDPATERLDVVVRRGLARDRAHRYGSAREFADDLSRAIAAYGAPMMAIEIQAQVSIWLGPTLMRRSRELAALLGGWRQLEKMTDEWTALHESAPVTGVRLRDMSVAVGHDTLDDAQTGEVMPAAISASATADTDLALPVIAKPSGAAMTATSGELTLPRAVSPRMVPRMVAPLGTINPSDAAIEARPALAVNVPRLEMSGPNPEPTRRGVVPWAAASGGRPEWVLTALPKPPARSRRPSLVLFVIAIVGMAAGLIVGRLLA